MALLAGIGAGLAAIGATAGAIGSSQNIKKQRQERDRFYRYASDVNEMRRHESIFDMPGGRAALKLQAERRADDIDAANNRAIAGGATVENQLAVRKSLNRQDSDLTARLLQFDDANRRAVDQRQLALDQSHSAGVQQSYVQDAQNWQAWGTQMAQSGIQLGMAGLLSTGVGAGTGAGTGAAGGMDMGGFKFGELAPAADTAMKLYNG